jgi:hypothetical protein
MRKAARLIVLITLGALALSSVPAHGHELADLVAPGERAQKVADG